MFIPVMRYLCSCYQDMAVKLRTSLSRSLGTFKAATSQMNRLANVSCRNRTKLVNNGCVANRTRTIAKTPKLFYLVPVTLTAIGCHGMGLFGLQAHCEYSRASSSRLIDEVNGTKTKDAVFPWIEFLKLLMPDVWYLLGAVVVSTVNVYIIYDKLL